MRARTTDLRLIVVTLTAGLLIAACGSSAGSSGSSGNAGGASSSAKVLQIGDIMSLSGSAGAAGIGVANSEELAADLINADGGLKVGNSTYKLEVKKYDDQGTAEGGIAAITKMYQQDGINLEVGTIASSVAIGMLPFIQRHQSDMVVVYTGASASSLTAPTNAFRMAISSPAVGLAHANYAKSQGWTSVVDVNDSTNPGQVAATDGFHKALAANGINLLSYQTIQRGQTDYTSLITKIRSMNPAYVELRLYPDDEVTLIKQAREAGWKVPFLVVSNLVPASVASLPASYVTDIHQAGWATIQDLISAGTPGAQQLFDAYKQKFGTDPGFLTMQGVEGIYSLAAGIQQAGSTKPADVIKAMACLKPYPRMVWPLKVTGGCVYDSQREVGVPIAVSVWSNGKLEFKTLQ